MQSADELRRENEALRQRIARTRADLETLIETSPAGVAIFDARTGRPVSFNREAARIVEALGQPGQPPARVLETVTCRFADGRELALARLPLSQPAGVAALRAEVIVLSVPDGREVRTLVNAAPIRGDGGEVESVVVTLQDLGPIEKAERLQTELLGMVSHELRSPLTAIKGSTATVLGAAAALAPAEMLQFFRIIDEQADRMGGLIGDLLARVAPAPPAADDARGDAGTPPGGPAEPREQGHMTPILVVDDDAQTLRYVCDALSSAGYAPLAAGDPGELAELVRTRRPRLALLDPLGPGAHGIELMQRVRELADIPVIFISGYGRDETIAEALELGAADYIVKPFSPTELTARVQAALRRLAERAPYRAGDLAIDYEQRRVTVAGRRVDLTATEYELLRVLSTGGGRVSTVDALLRQVWGGRRAGDPKLLRAFVKRLRHKLGDDAARPAYVFTERGVGYRMAAPGEPVADPSA